MTIGALPAQVSGRKEFAVVLDDARWRGILRVLSDASGADGDAVTFDTHRAPCTRMTAITDPFPDARVDACERDFPWSGRSA
jgi:hypothetical protein